MLDPVVLDAAIRHDDTLEILDDLVQVRVALESDMVRAAAESMTDGDIRELGVLLAQLESQIDDPVRYLESDTRYHDFILQRSGNRLGRTIIRTIHPYARASSRYNPPTDEADVKQSHGGHVAIYRRLAARDGEGAAAAMEEHIAGAWYRRRAKRRTSQSELDPQPEE